MKKILGVLATHGHVDHLSAAAQLIDAGCGGVWLHEAEAPAVRGNCGDPAPAVLLHVATGMLHAGRGEHRSALAAFAAAMKSLTFASFIVVLSHNTNSSKAVTATGESSRQLNGILADSGSM